MNNKKFTLTELIIAIIVISILASIVMVKILDMKNKSISAAIGNNTKIIQTAVDRHSIDKNGTYPIKNNLEVNLTNPQLIDTNQLQKEGYLKKDLDTSKVKSQYYWLDVFGLAWGSTIPTVNDITSITDSNGKTRLEFITPSGATAYRVYEVIGYNKSGIKANSQNSHYKLASEVKVKKERQRINFEIPNRNKVYLISVVDKYDQETAPVGAFYKGTSNFKPIISGEGIYEFEIESFEEMFWVDYQSVQDTPGNSTITYRFKVKDEDGKYMEWTNDYFSLASSKGIKVEVEMKGDADGNKPSLYDLSINYRYAYEEDIPQPIGEPTYADKPSLICPAGYTHSNISRNPKVGEKNFYTYLTKLPNKTSINKIKHLTFNNYYIAGVQYEYEKDGIYVLAKGTYEIPAGSCVNIIYELERIEIKKDNHDVPEGGTVELGVIPEANSPYLELCKERCVPICENCTPPCLENCNIPVPKDDDCKEEECIRPPACNEGDVGCIPPVCEDYCHFGPPDKPDPRDKELADPEWTTLDELRFFASGPEGVPTRWIRVDHSEKWEEGKTRVVYRFASSDGSYWSKQEDEVSKLRQSRSIMVVAYLQVHKDYKDDISIPSPEVISVKVIHDKGDINLSLSRPSLTILPVKDNNEGRDVFSDTSTIDWQYRSFDPKGRKIEKIEWEGDKETYPVGTHLVRARIMNETGLWSEWVQYKFDVLPEKPVAVIKTDKLGYAPDEQVQWSATNSYDPDGDNIVEFEWRGDKRDSYSAEGRFLVELRVKDSEGNWSDWTSKEIEVADGGFIIYRLEVEDKIKTTHDKESTAIRKVEGYSGNAYVDINNTSGVITFTFTGTGFDLKANNLQGGEIRIDQTIVYKPTEADGPLLSIRNLPFGEHVVTIKKLPNGKIAGLDYIDIFSNNDKPSIQNLEPFIVQNDVTSDYTNSTFSTDYGQSVKYKYDLHKDSFVTVTVLDMNNQVVRVLKQNQKEQGGTIYQHTFYWDGKNDYGNIVESGRYTVKIEAVGVSKKNKVTTTMSTSLVNNPPVYRVEAEDANKITAISSNIRSDASLSGGKSIGFNTNGKMTLPFVGTGVIIKFDKSAGGNIIVDNISIRSNSTKNPDILIIENLPYGQHILEINNASGVPAGRIDYIDVLSSNYTPDIKFTKSVSYYKERESTFSQSHFDPFVGEQMNFHYDLIKDSFVTASVYNDKGEVVRTLHQEERKSGGTIYQHSLLWDGKNDNGDKVKAGNYYLTIRAVGLDKVSEIEKSTFVKVRNDVPSSKIEAEDSTLTRSGYAISSKATLSGGKGIYFNSGGYLEITFEGTGIDIYYDLDRVGANILLDNVLYHSPENKEASLFTIRDLTYGKHKVRIAYRSGGTNAVIDYFNIYK